MAQTIERHAKDPVFQLSKVQLSSAHIYLPRGYVRVCSDNGPDVSLFKALVADTHAKLPPGACHGLHQKVIEYMREFDMDALRKRTDAETTVINLHVFAAGLQDLLEAEVEETERQTKKIRSDPSPGIDKKDLIKNLLEGVGSFIKSLHGSE